MPQDTVIKINDGKVYTIVNGYCTDTTKWIDFMDSIEMLPKGKKQQAINEMHEKVKKPE